MKIKKTQRRNTNNKSKYIYVYILNLGGEQFEFSSNLLKRMEIPTQIVDLTSDTFIPIVSDCMQ